MGYEIDSFTEPSIALEKFKQSSQKYSMVLTDLRMPSMSGIELAQKIREIDDNVIINLITAFNIDDDLKKIKYSKKQKSTNFVKNQ